MLPIRSPTRNTCETSNNAHTQHDSNYQSYANSAQQSGSNCSLVNNSAQVSFDLCATSIKLPSFWTSCPDAWFIHAEMQFATKGISVDKTKYEHVITALPQEVILTVLDFIQNPPRSNLYENLKKILVDRHSLSETVKLEKILSDSEMGNRKPSEFYRSLALLAGTSFSHDLLTKLWLRKLPKGLNVALTGSNHKDTNEMIQLADKIWEVMFNSELSCIKEHTSHSLENIVENLTRTLCESVNKLCIEVNSIKSQLEDRQSRPQFRNNFRRNSRSRDRVNSNNWLCKYHYRFGERAIRCEQPCSFSKTSLN